MKISCRISPDFPITLTHSSQIMAIVSLRTYQSRIVAVAENFNTVAVLPTGAGKTLIAAELIKRRGGKSLFLVPTCMLVEQQSGQLRSWTGMIVGEYMSGNTFPSHFDILVSTPKAFETVLLRNQVSGIWVVFI